MLHITLPSFEFATLLKYVSPASRLNELSAMSGYLRIEYKIINSLHYLIASACDNQHTIVSHIVIVDPGKKAEEGTIVISTKRAVELFQSITTMSDSVTLHNTIDTHITITYQRHKIQLIGLDPTLYFDIKINSIERFDSAHQPSPNIEMIQVPTKLFLESLLRIKHAIHPGGKPALAGAYISFHDQLCECVATNGAKIIHSQFNLTQSVQTVCHCIIDAQALDIIMRIFSNTIDSNIEISISQSACLLRNENTIFLAQIIDAIYPNYQAFFTQTYPIKTTIPKIELLDAIKTMNILKDEQAIMKWKMIDHTLTISLHNSKDSSFQYDLTFPETIDTEIMMGYDIPLILSCIEPIAQTEIQLQIQPSKALYLTYVQNNITSRAIIAQSRIT